MAGEGGGVISMIKGVVRVAGVVAIGSMAARAVIAPVAGDGVELIRTHHQRALGAALIDRVVTAVVSALSVRGRLGTVGIPGVFGDPRCMAVGGVVGEFDGAGHGFLRLFG